MLPCGFVMHAVLLMLLPTAEWGCTPQQSPHLRERHSANTTPFCNNCRLASPAAFTSPRAAALLHLWLRLADDSLNEDAYLADVAGLHTSTSPEGVAGLEVRVDGFSHRLPELVGRVFAALAACEVRRWLEWRRVQGEEGGRK